MTLHLQRLSVRYGRRMALADVTAAARPGAVTVVVGPNAAGKSTLLRACLGMLAPQEGGAFLDGAPVHRIPPWRLARRMAYVPQRPVVAAALTVRHVVELGRYALPPDSERVQEALERFDLVDVADRFHHELSVGQQQRVACARAHAQLASDGVFLLDEPTASMDLRHQRDTLLLLRARAQQGATVVAVMHDLALAAETADDAWILREGRLMAAGSVRTVMTPALLQEVFQVPFTWVDGGSGQRLLVNVAAAAS